MSETIRRAISIQQPFAEQILRGEKREEYRSRATNIRERVYVYASLTPGPSERWKGTTWRPGDLPTGLLVGTVDIVDCKWDERRQSYAYALAHPRRLAKPILPVNRKSAAPAFWRPQLPDVPAKPQP